MVVVDAGQLESRRAPTTSLEGWRSFINADPSDFKLLPTDRWQGLDQQQRRDYDEARIAHHAELVVVTTSTIEEITNEGQMLVLMNQREIGARRGLIVSGDAATGKTTAIKQLGRVHELRIRARFPDGRDRIPVVYVTEHLPATFIYAGIDVERCGVFTGTRGRQLAGRCGLIATGAFPYREEWTQLVAALEATLRLHHHQPSALVEHTKYLHHRTGGMIGSLVHLVHLVRAAAIRAVLTGDEALTRGLLDKLDRCAGSRRRRARSSPGSAAWPGIAITSVCRHSTGAAESATRRASSTR